eukprot:6174144-Pleurochrysis_carterae.AAC.1
MCHNSKHGSISCRDELRGRLLRSDLHLKVVETQMNTFIPRKNTCHSSRVAAGCNPTQARCRHSVCSDGQQDNTRDPGVAARSLRQWPPFQRQPTYGIHSESLHYTDGVKIGAKRSSRPRSLCAFSAPSNSTDLEELRDIIPHWLAGLSEAGEIPGWCSLRCAGADFCLLATH